MIGGVLRPGTVMPLASYGVFTPCSNEWPEAAFFRLNPAYLVNAMRTSVNTMQGMTVHAVYKDQAPHRPTIGIFAGCNENLAIAAYGQRVYPRADWFFIPNIPGNTFIQGGKVFVHGAIRFDWDALNRHSATLMMFPDHARVDRLFSMVPFPAEIEERLVSLGHVVTNPAALKEITDDKVEGHRVFEKAGIQSPHFTSLARSEYDNPLPLRRDESIRAAILKFISGHGISDFVIKPAAGSRGTDVRMFEKGEIDSATWHARHLFSRWDRVIIEERIKSYPLIIDGKRIDWNIRVVVPPGDLTGWEIIDTTEVRFNEFNGQPVNKSRGAGIAELEAAFDHIGLSTEARDKIVGGLNALSIKIREALHGRLADASGAKAALYEQMLGLDVIVDEGLNLFMIEVNSGVVGGIGSLIDIREDYNKFRTVNMLADNLFESARRAYETNSALAAGNAEREYLEDYYSWLELSLMSINERHPWFRFLRSRRARKVAIKAADKAIAINPGKAEAWYVKGCALAKLRSYRKALKCLNKATEIYPEFSDAWKLKSAVLALMGRQIDALICSGMIPDSNASSSIELSKKLKRDPTKSGQ